MFKAFKIGGLKIAVKPLCSYDLLVLDISDNLSLRSLLSYYYINYLCK